MKLAAPPEMDLWRYKTLFKIFILICLFSVTVLAETPLELPAYLNQYEVNSETIYFSDSKLVQSDLRLLIGRKFNFLKADNLRIAVGGYGLYQDSEAFASTYRHGGIAQAKLSLWENWLFFVYEYHYFKMRRIDVNIHENRYGIYGGYYNELNLRNTLDIYAETFHIPSISKKHLLSSGRASIYSDTQLGPRHVFDFLAEVYAKDSPANWGGSRTDLRLGLKFQPWTFISAKVFTPIASSEDDATGEWQAQVNIYKVGDF